MNEMLAKRGKEMVDTRKAIKDLKALKEAMLLDKKMGRLKCNDSFLENRISILDNAMYIIKKLYGSLAKANSQIDKLMLNAMKENVEEKEKLIADLKEIMSMPQWVKMSERHPEPEPDGSVSLYLVARKDKMITTAYWECNEWRDFSHTRDINADNYEYWIKIPIVPAEVAEP